MLGLVIGMVLMGQGPPEISPFGPRAAARPDAIPGVVELSDGTRHRGQVFLTRDARLRVLDEATQRHREVPLDQVNAIACQVKKEWVEKEWRFLENANDQKVYTGRTYPVREYVHTITLKDGRSLRGRMSALVYVGGLEDQPPRKFVLHQRDKGPPGTELKALTYVRAIRLGEEDDEAKEDAEADPGRSVISPARRK